MTACSTFLFLHQSVMALIAATAFHLELTLVTANQRHFPMPELSLRAIA
jgi:hypothetical protein